MAHTENSNDEVHNSAGSAELCVAVSDKVNSPKGGVRFAWERIVRIWSGIGHHDQLSDKDVAQIGKMWRDKRTSLRCTQLGFSVTNGSIWKLGVERNSQDFLETALIDWQLSPNDMDCTGETPLDYIERELITSKGTSRERFLKSYRDLFIEYGAKRASELTPAERVGVGCP
ncbi:MAG: hypothetical protein NBV68_01845 [Erythrobacter sp.]|nr:hypothetical protein [Erythrobacter sp.]